MRAGYTRYAAGDPAEVGGMFKDLAEATRHSATRSTLNGLMTWLGEAGLQAATVSAGLQAAVDQHAASVRDALGDPERGPNAIALASYATASATPSSRPGGNSPRPPNWTGPRPGGQPSA